MSNPKCPGCKTELPVQLKDMHPGNSVRCLGCGAKIEFTGQDGRQIQKSLQGLGFKFRKPSLPAPWEGSVDPDGYYSPSEHESATLQKVCETCLTPEEKGPRQRMALGLGTCTRCGEDGGLVFMTRAEIDQTQEQQTEP